MLYAGLRRGELLALEWNDIDFEKKVIHVNKSVEILTNQPRIKRPKTKAGTRDVPMPEILYDALYSIRKKFLILTEPNGMIYNSSEHF